MPPAGLEPTVPASKWPQNHAFDREATEIGFNIISNQFLSRRNQKQRQGCHWTT